MGSSRRMGSQLWGPMPNLFVDCDDTLILFCFQPGEACPHGGVHPYGASESYPQVPNERLIAGMRQFRVDNPEALIVIWSGGGAWYAMSVIKRLNIHDLQAQAWDKFGHSFDFVTEGDIVVDDQAPLQRALTSQQFKPMEWPPEETR